MNPYQVLNVAVGADKKTVIQAAALAMRDKKYTGKDVAMAQKMLLDPEASAANEFIHILDVDPLLAEAPPLKTPDFSELAPLSSLSRLDLFDNEG